MRCKKPDTCYTISSKMTREKARLCGATCCCKKKKSYLSRELKFNFPKEETHRRFYSRGSSGRALQAGRGSAIRDASSELWIQAFPGRFAPQTASVPARPLRPEESATAYNYGLHKQRGKKNRLSKKCPLLTRHAF